MQNNLSKEDWVTELFYLIKKYKEQNNSKLDAIGFAGSLHPNVPSSIIKMIATKVYKEK